MFPERDRNILLSIQSAEFAYSTFAITTVWRLIIKDVELATKAIYSVKGSNMVGKSTFLRILAGLDTLSTIADATGAPLRISGELISDVKAGPKVLSDFRVRDALLLDHRDHMFPTLSIWDNVRVVGDLPLGPNGEAARAALTDFLMRSEIEGLSSERRLGDISSGGQAYARLARAYCCRTRLLLVDEITGHLDDDNARRFFGRLPDIVRNGATVLIVSHLARDHDLAKTVALKDSIPHGTIELTQKPSSSGTETCVEHCIS
jgi:ABC-type lipoprotein export system ATPase subunit